MPECDCLRPTTPEGVYHESTCALRLTDRDRDLLAERDELEAEVRRLREDVGTAYRLLSNVHETRYPEDASDLDRSELRAFGAAVVLRRAMDGPSKGKGEL